MIKKQILGTLLTVDNMSLICRKLAKKQGKQMKWNLQLLYNLLWLLSSVLELEHDLYLAWLAQATLSGWDSSVDKQGWGRTSRRANCKFSVAIFCTAHHIRAGWLLVSNRHVWFTILCSLMFPNRVVQTPAGGAGLVITGAGLIIVLQAPAWPHGAQ